MSDVDKEIGEIEKTRKVDTVVPEGVVPDELPVFSSAHWTTLFTQNEHEELALEFLKILDHFYNVCYYSLSRQHRAYINEFVENFLFFFSHSDFQLPTRFVNKFIFMNPVICNVVSFSDFKTTTPWVAKLAMRKDSYFRVLALYNSRCDVDLNTELFFDVSTYLGSMWWSYFWLSPSAFSTEETYNRIRKHLHELNDDYILFSANARVSFFPITYVAPESEEIFKERINALAAKAFSNVQIRNTPKRKSLAIVTGRWFNTAVYTSVSPLVKSLAGHYDITLVHYNPDPEQIYDKEMFQKLILVEMKNEKMELEELQDNNFAAALYPDIGMEAESIYLSNIRLAPLQMAMYGHPVSTYGSKIDYFIGGRKIEHPTEAKNNYRERLVMLPGLGVYPLYPTYDRTEEDVKPDKDVILVNCAWTAQKCNYPLMETLAEVVRQSKRRVVFHIFSGSAIAFYNGFIPFARDVASVVGKENVLIEPRLAHTDYMKKMAIADFSLESYPFGGFNTVIDSLTLQIPIISWQGKYTFSRFGSAVLETIGFDELIAHNREEYISLIVRMIHDDDYRRQWREEIAVTDYKELIAQHEDPDSLRRAVDYLIDNHDRLQSEGLQEPIMIE